MIRDLNPCRGNRLFSSPKHPDQLWGPSCLMFDGKQGSLPRAKRLRCEVDHSSPFSGKVKNVRRYNSSHPICLFGVDRYEFVFLPFASP